MLYLIIAAIAAGMYALLQTDTSESLQPVQPDLQSVQVGKEADGRPFVIYPNGVKRTAAKIDKIAGKYWSSSWLANNPGNITYSEKYLKTFRDKFNAYTTPLPWGMVQFYIFPTYRDGFNACFYNLRIGYKNLNFRQTFAKYGEPAYVEQYVNRVVSYTGLNPLLTIGQLTDDQLNRVVEAIQSIEGWCPGTETIQGQLVSTNEPEGITFD